MLELNAMRDKKDKTTPEIRAAMSKVEEQKVATEMASVLEVVLPINKYFTSVNLSYYPITEPRSIQRILISMVRNSCVQELNLTGCDLNDREVDALADVLANNKSVQITRLIISSMCMIYRILLIENRLNDVNVNNLVSAMNRSRCYVKELVMR